MSVLNFFPGFKKSSHRTKRPHIADISSVDATVQGNPNKNLENYSNNILDFDKYDVSSLFEELDFAMDVIRSERVKNSNQATVLQIFRMPTLTGTLFAEDYISNIFNDKRLRRALAQESPLRLIRRYRTLDVDIAKEVILALWYISLTKTRDYQDRERFEAVGFASRMAKIGGRRSVETIVRAMLPYIMSGGKLEESRDLEENIYFMSDAIAEDRIPPRVIEELGLSHTLRLYAFQKKKDAREGAHLESTPDISEYIEHFCGFPAIGAEFHIPTTKHVYPNLLERLAIVNMAQYQRGSPIPPSRIDEDVMEVRMNPSVYPVAIANWNTMRVMIPELNKQYFTICIGGKHYDFDEHPSGYGRTVDLLQTLGSIVYASLFKNVPTTETPGELRFGEYYIGQTVKLENGRYRLFGGRSAYHDSQSVGQLNLFVGYGDTFPHQAYYLSMALIKPELLGIVERYAGRRVTPHQAVGMKEGDIRHILQTMHETISGDKRLSRVTEHGQRIVQLFKN